MSYPRQIFFKGRTYFLLRGYPVNTDNVLLGAAVVLSCLACIIGAVVWWAWG